MTGQFTPPGQFLKQLLADFPGAFKQVIETVLSELRTLPALVDAGISRQVWITKTVETIRDNTTGCWVFTDDDLERIIDWLTPDWQVGQ